MNEIPDKPGWEWRRAAGGFTEREFANDLQDALVLILFKFHKETDCGKDGMHWAECGRAVNALGWGSYEAMKALCGWEPSE